MVTERLVSRRSKAEAKAAAQNFVSAQQNEPPQRQVPLSCDDVSNKNCIKSEEARQ